ncbi:MAG: PAS domain S-box protein, partial [Syntrophales bacterium]|nr:PAS domain S-box protein [Syntrophales bacterium]
MKTSVHSPKDRTDLPRLAEKRLRNRQDNVQSLTKEDLRKLVYELQVQRAELELMNEELQKANIIIEEGLRNYADLYDFAPVGYFSWDRRGTIIEANRTGAGLLGIERRLLIGLPFRQFIANESHKDFDCFLKKVFTSGTKENCRLKIQCHGSTLHVQIESSLSNTGKRQKKSCRSVVMDITGSMNSDDESQKFAEEISDLYNNAPCGYHSLGPGGTYIRINDTYIRWLGYKREELIGKHKFSDIMTPESQKAFAVNYPLFKARGWIRDVEYHLIRKDGTILPVLLNATAIKDANGNFLMSRASIFDNTERKRAEEERLLLEKQLYEAQKMEAVGRLAGGIAHDFNNILSSIIGYSELSADESDDAVRRSDIDQVLKAAERAKNLVKQILAFSRHHKHDKKVIDMGAVIREALILIASTMPSTIEIRRNITDTPCIINADSTQMHQILMNLCTNASHAMGEKGGILEVQLSLTEIEPGIVYQNHDLEPGTYAFLRVSDTGHGIDHVNLNRIFYPFFTTKSVGEGTGLGLSVVYGIVKNHGGTVTVTSNPGEGATFNIYLPCVDGAGSTDRVNIYKTLLRGHERILYVEDERLLADLGNRLLSSLGYDVTFFTDSSEALEAFKADPGGFDLLITDMTMPHMSGSELSKEILKEKSALPIILCTGYNEYMNEKKAAKLGIKKFIMKPLSRKELASALREV